uniref:Acetyl-coenzyme A transporter 1 n=1 Tax=Setaria digitata TaxID=48799 RepID=A0A915PVE0_9BILA
MASNCVEPIFGIVELRYRYCCWTANGIPSLSPVLLVTATVAYRPEVSVRGDKRNSIDNKSDELELGIFQTYVVLWKILRLKPVIWMVIVLLTGKFAFAATDGITGLKLISMGMPKDKLSSIAIFLTPLQVVLPWVVGKYIAGPRPLDVFLLAYPYRIFLSGVFAAVLWWTPSLSSEDFPLLVYAVWVIVYCFHQIASYSMFVSLMAFYAQISDPAIGGTYMTLLNTLSNLGGNWPITFILSLADHFTFKNCVAKGTKTILGSCNTEVSVNQCTMKGNVCEIAVDGYYISVALCSVVGVIWYKLMFRKIRYFQEIPRRDWKIVKR